jgi:hypothetical protein|tara:strand:+ start:172 stop:546 length:375 start_codon:yes stop_codon:yes gene_type:complete
MGWSPAQVGALENCGIKVEDATGDIQWREFETIDIIKPDPIKSPKSNIQYEATRLPDYNKVGNIIAVTVAWRGGTYMVKMFFPTVKKPSRKEVQDQVRKVYPGSKLVTYQVSEYDSGEPIIQTR